jgi:hypothetical protein
VFVEKGLIAVGLEIGTDDLEAFGNLPPDELWQGLGEEPDVGNVEARASGRPLRRRHLGGRGLGRPPGHLHQRRDRYRAGLEIVPDDAEFKPVSLEILEEERT